MTQTQNEHSGIRYDPMAPASQGSRDRDLSASAASAAVTAGDPPRAPGPSPPASPSSLHWFASFVLISQDGFLDRRRGVISADPDQVSLSSDAGEKIRSWKSDSIGSICFGARFCFDDLRIGSGLRWVRLGCEIFSPCRPWCVRVL
jgi:hypothetical protein